MIQPTNGRLIATRTVVRTTTSAAASAGAHRRAPADPDRDQLGRSRRSSCSARRGAGRSTPGVGSSSRCTWRSPTRSRARHRRHAGGSKSSARVGDQPPGTDGSPPRGGRRLKRVSASGPTAGGRRRSAGGRERLMQIQRRRGPDRNSVRFKIEATVTFNRAVAVTGTPRLEIQVGANARHALHSQTTYVRSLTPTKLAFSYTVVEGEEDTDGIAIGGQRARPRRRHDPGRHKGRRPDARRGERRFLPQGGRGAPDVREREDVHRRREGHRHVQRGHRLRR